MLIVGSICGAVGYVFARQSLKGITQPATNPFLKESDDLDRRPRQGADFLNEKDLIAKVKSQTSGANIAKEKQKQRLNPRNPNLLTTSRKNSHNPKLSPSKLTTRA